MHYSSVVLLSSKIANIQLLNNIHKRTDNATTIIAAMVEMVRGAKLPAQITHTVAMTETEKGQELRHRVAHLWLQLVLHQELD